MNQQESFDKLTHRENLNPNNGAYLQGVLNILFHEETNSKVFFDAALKQCLELTGSKYGFIFQYKHSDSEFVLSKVISGITSESSHSKVGEIIKVDQGSLWVEKLQQGESLLCNRDDGNKHDSCFGKGLIQDMNFIALPYHFEGKLKSLLCLSDEEKKYSLQDLSFADDLCRIIWKQTQLKQTLEREQYLKNVLLGIRNVNQLIAQVTDPITLIEDACAKLTEQPCYFGAWFALFDENGRVVHLASAGNYEGQDKIKTQILSGKFPAPMMAALQSEEVIINCSHADGDVPSFPDVSDKIATMCAHVKSDNHSYGVLSVSLPELFVHLEPQHHLFREVADDIGFALNKIELQKQYQGKVAELMERQNFIQTTLDNLPIGLAVNTVEPAVDFEYFNDNFARFYRAPKEELMKPEGFWSAAYEDENFREHIRRKVLEDCASGDLSRMIWEDVPITRKGQETTYITAMNIPIPDKNLVISTVWDVTARKLAENALLESEEKYRAAFMTSPDAININTMDGIYVDVNQGFEDITGYSRDEVIGKNSMELSIWVNPDDRRLLVQNLQKHGKVENLETTFRMKDGNLRTGTMSACFISIKGAPHILSVTRDITERIKSLKAIRESEEKYRALFETANDAIFLIRSGIFIDCNSKTEEMFRCSREEILNRTAADFSPPLQPNGMDSETAATLYLEAAMHGAPQFFEWQHLTFDGTPFTAEISLKLVDLEGEKLLQAIVRDITFRKNAEETIRQNENRFRKVLENMPVLLNAFDESGNIIVWNKACETTTGFTADEMIRNPGAIEALYPDPDYREAFLRSLHDKRKGVNELELTARNGSKKTISWFDTYHLAEIPGWATWGIGLDITERKKAEKLQRAQYRIAHAMASLKNLNDVFEAVRKELNELIDTTNFYIVFYDAESEMLISPFERDEKDNILQWPAGKSLTGIVVRKAESILLSKSDIMKLAQKDEVILRGSRAEAWLGVPLVINKQVAGAIVVQSYHDPHAYDTSSIEILEIISNQLSLYIEKMRHEQNLLIAKEKAEESDKLKTAFLNNMSHEIRTPLNGILGFTDLLNDDTTTPENRHYYARIITQSGNQLLSIIDDIISISTIEAGQEKLRETVTDLNQVMALLYEQFKNKIDTSRVLLNYQSHIEPDESKVVIDKTKLIQVLSNLIGNAIKFTERGSVEFRCRIAGNLIEFCVEDTGIGIPLEFHEMIFERFRQVRFNTSREYGGNGLGLAISKAYVELMGGKIWVESEPGHGAKFYFTIACKPSDPVSKKKQAAKPTDETPANMRTILYAEDEYSNYMLVDIMLKSMNHKIIHAGTGPEAIELFNNNPEIDLVLMDLKLPGMSGLDAAREIKRVKPSMPIIALTAYALSGDRERSLEAGCDDYLSKPFRRSDLLELLNKYLP